MGKGHYWSKDFQYLHRDVWEWHKGKIPEGCVVHHSTKNEDGEYDKSKNQITDLFCMTRGEHTALHWRGRRHSAKTIALMTENCKLRPEVSSLTKERMSQAAKGKSKTEEHRQKLSEAASRRWAKSKLLKLKKEGAF